MRNLDIELKRIELESKEKEAHSAYKKSEHNWKNVCHQLESLQEECKHEHAVIKHGYQGGGNYYCKCTCWECGRNGYRYIPQYHLHLHNEWCKDNPKQQLTLEEAIERGKRMGKGHITVQ